MAATNEESSSQENPPEFKATKNYTSESEKKNWWYFKTWSQNYKSMYPPTPFYATKEEFRTRRGFMDPKRAALRIRFENSDDIGAFVRLTNSYCLVGCEESSENFINTIKGDLPEIPVLSTTMAGCRIVGRLCVGNTKGLLVPDTVFDTELQQIQNELPEGVKVEKLEERLSALGNVIACNDNVALIHPDINKESEEIIADTLQVEVYRCMIAKNPLVGSYCVLNNHGGILPTEISNNELENLSSLLQIPLRGGTVNSGCKLVAAGLAVNDFIGYAGMKTTAHEFSVMENVFQLRNYLLK